MKSIKKIGFYTGSIFVSYLLISFVYQYLIREELSSTTGKTILDATFVFGDSSKNIDAKDIQFWLSFLVAIATLIFSTPFLEKIRNHFFAIEVSLIVRPQRSGGLYSYRLEFHNVSNRLLSFDTYIFFDEFRWNASRKLRLSENKTSCVNFENNGNSINVFKMYPGRVFSVYFLSNRIEKIRVFINDHSKKYQTVIIRQTFYSNFDARKLNALKFSIGRMIIFGLYFFLFTLVIIVRLIWLYLS